MSGKLLIFTGPSGAGKSTLTNHVLEKRDDFELSVSACTRSRRPGEVDGIHYYFMNPNEFKSKIEAEDFVEWEEVYPGKYYGTLKSEIQRIWDKGKNIIFDIDVKGAINIKKHYPDRTLTVLVKPPSTDILKQRLKKRSTETEEMLEIRIAKAEYELSLEKEFDLVIVNIDLEESMRKVDEIVERLLTVN